MKDQLVFDTTDVDTIADSDHVGSHTLSGSGDLITSGDGSADNVANTFEGLDTRSFLFGYDSVGDNWDRIQQISGAMKVYVDGGDFAIDVQVDGVYDVVNNTNPDNVGLISHVRGATPADADQTFRSTGATATSDDVTAANVHGMDVNSFGMVFDGTAWDRLRGTGGAVHINDGGNSITVDATDLDIRDLAHTQDSVRLGDGTSLFTSTTVGGDIGLDVYQLNDPAVSNTAMANGATTLTTGGTSQNVVASPLANRKALYLYNDFNKKMYVGTTGVTTSTGFPVSPGSYLELRVGAAVDVEYVGTDTGHSLRYLELS
jgi:hypothetical protein